MDFKSGDEAAMGLDLDTPDTVEDAAPTTKGKAVSMAKQDKGSEENRQFADPPGRQSGFNRA